MLATKVYIMGLSDTTAGELCTANNLAQSQPECQNQLAECTAMCRTTLAADLSCIARPNKSLMPPTNQTDNCSQNTASGIKVNLRYTVKRCPPEPSIHTATTDKFLNGE